MSPELNLRSLKSDLQDKVRALDRLAGKRTAIVERLSEEFGVKGLKDAQTRLKGLEKELAEEMTLLEAAVDELSEFEGEDEDNENAT